MWTIAASIASNGDRSGECLSPFHPLCLPTPQRLKAFATYVQVTGSTGRPDVSLIKNARERKEERERRRRRRRRMPARVIYHVKELESGEASRATMTRVRRAKTAGGR